MRSLGENMRDPMTKGILLRRRRDYERWPSVRIGDV